MSRVISQVHTECILLFPDKGTRNAIFVLKRLVERSVEKQKDVYTCFIDYSKAFDTVKHDSLVELLQSLDVDDADTRLLTNLYWPQTAAVRCDKDLSEWMSIKQGVRQGCVASPHLFALYTEMIMREIEDMEGFRIGGKVVNNLRCADDTVILAESEEQLQQLINTVVTESELKGLYLNSTKSFAMVFFRKQKLIRLVVYLFIEMYWDKYNHLYTMGVYSHQMQEVIRRSGEELGLQNPPLHQ